MSIVGNDFNSKGNLHIQSVHNLASCFNERNISLMFETKTGFQKVILKFDEYFLLD